MEGEGEKVVQVKLLTLNEAKELMMEAISEVAFESMMDENGSKRAVVELFAGSKMLTAFDKICMDRFGFIPEVSSDKLKKNLEDMDD